MGLSKLLRYLLRDYILKAVDDDAEADPEGADAEGEEGEQESPPADEQVEDGDPEDDGEGEEDADGDDSELTVSLGDDEPPPQEERRGAAPGWVKDLRKRNRELLNQVQQRDAELAKYKGKAAGQPQAVVVGPKPTMDSCDFDEARYERELEAWHDRRSQEAQQTKAREEAEAKEREAWKRTQDAYEGAKGALKVDGIEDAEEIVQDTLSTPQLGIMLHALEPKQAALMVYALGNNPKKLKELASVTDPVKFTVALTRLEAQMKVNKSKSAPPPERKVRGTVSSAAVVDNQLERLRKEARETGDYSKVADFRRHQEAKAKRA